MPYLPDFGNTPEIDVRDYQRMCMVPSCQHMRYRHGEARRIRGYGITYSPGPCEQCKCPTFADEPPIGEDEFFMILRILGIEGARLIDFGIDPLPSESPPPQEPTGETW